MGQEEIIKLLKKEKEKMSIGQISKILKIHPSLVSKSIRSLLKYNEISFAEVDKKIALLNYGCKHRMRIYYV